MKRTIAVIAALMLVPSTTLASSIRPGSRVTHADYQRSYRGATCKDETEKYKEKCDIVIDETGVKGPVGHITNVVQWTTEDQPFNTGGAIVGGVVGTGVGAGVGLMSCMVAGPFCLITAPAIMSTGTTAGGGVGGSGSAKFFTIVGDDDKGNRLIQEFKYRTYKDVKKASKLLLNTTKLAEGETRK